MINNIYVGIIILLCYSVGFTLCFPANPTEMHTALDTTNDTIPFETTKTGIQCVIDFECGSNSKCSENFCICVSGYVFDFSIKVCVGSNKSHMNTGGLLTWVGIAVAVAAGIAIR